MRDVDSKMLSGMQYHQQNPYVYSDTSFISVTDVEDSTIITRCNYWTDLTQWKTAFVRKDKESRKFVWSTGPTMNIITSYYTYAPDDNYSDPDTLCLMGRSFNTSTGELLEQRELIQVVDDDHEKRYDFRLSTDSSHMLVFIHDDYEEAGDDQDSIDEQEIWNADLFLLRPDMKKIQKTNVGIIVSEDYADDYNPELAVNNNGMVFYTFSRVLSDTLVQQSLVRLDISQNRADTLTAIFSRIVPYSWSTVRSEPREPLLQTLSGDTALLAWPYFYGNDLKLLTVSKLDFQTKSFVFTDTLLFDDETCEYLIDDDELEDYRLFHCVALPSGETVLVLGQAEKYAKSAGHSITMPTPGGIGGSGGVGGLAGSTTLIGIPNPVERYSDNGPIVLIKLADNGAVQWKSSIVREEVSSVIGRDFPYHVTDSSFCLLYRDENTDDGIVFSEFMLADGRSRWKEIPVTFSSESTWNFKHTLWFRDAVVLYGGEGFFHSVCIRMTPSGKYTWFDKENARRIVRGKRVEE